MCSKTRRIWFFAVYAGEVEKAARPTKKGRARVPKKGFRWAVYRRVPESR